MNKNNRRADLYGSQSRRVTDAANRLDNVCLNRTKLQAGFKELFQTTIFGYLTDCRMEQTKELIRKSQFETIAEVSSLIGYKNHQHFTVAFKKKFGYLPRELKN